MAFVTGGKHFGQYTFEHWFDHEYSEYMSEDKYIIDSFCGLECFKCEFKQNDTCKGCFSSRGKPFDCDCEVADCAISRKKKFCGECERFPCDLLKRHSYDKEDGDNGARIEHCRKIIEEQNKKP